jgi:type I restriction enzyme S subunit
MGELKTLPEGWEYVNLGELFLIERGGSPRPIDDYLTDSADGINWIKIGDTKGISKYIHKTREKIKPEGLYKSRMVYVDDFILSNSMSFGHPYIMKTNGCIHDGWLVIRTNKEIIDTDYLYHILSSSFVYRQFSMLAKGSTVKNLNIEAVKQVYIYFPPLSEQYRIVAKIEELFSSLDKGIESLKTAHAQLKTYRQAVLKWAFEGKLTNENVKDGELPEGWKLQSINEIAVKITDGEHFRPKTQESGVPFLSAKDVRDHGVSFDDPLFISEKTASKALQRCNPEMGDILIVSRGATVGRMCIVNTNQTFCLLGSVILIKTKKEVDSRYITYILKSPFANQKMIAVSGATAQQAIYLRDIKNILIPIAPPSEQHRIVSEIETRLSVCDKLEESITQSLLQAEGLRQSILKKAFEGKLVPQSPNDEPACILLERIRAERAAMPAKNATRNKR